ncbi:nicotinate-nucleotide--dimethylbenzimidazole phosphoribosyltransferase [Streptomyces sp. NBC_01214]|uniref:nicotinate-nucleotide--dimethylbenzimidazole phosphoribosyltransferase n=1 Tax=Streptomyces sp. NBC_01214 TaxID=2903777 RepID=UPI00224F2090|nr:nicotinate-nucleotide--dimethylbenzimidazole phosphoribosyltransferase [Streptomyces sp. NBC_01214]MCX4802693.1 nicotinate-nucleotide--dimethylbenzimidazole phosphoribosyltransferase [Streptomyces sp. NBC_01214]
MTDTGQVPGEGLPDNAGMVDQQSVPAPVQIPAPIPAGYAFQDLMDNPAEPEDEELLLMPSGQGAWSDPQVVPPAPAFPAAPQLGEPQRYPDPSYAAGSAYPEAPAAYTEFPPPVFPDGGYSAGAHETGGRDSGALDLGGLVVPPPAVPAAPVAAAAPVRRPLHMGPPMPEANGGVVRSLADRGPAAAPAQAAVSTPVAPVPMRQAGPPTTGPEYLDVPRAEAAPAPAAQLGEIPPQAGAPWTPEPVAEPAPAPAEAAAQPVEPEPVPAPAEAAVQPEPVAVEPQPEPLVVEPQPEPIAVQPVAVEPEPQPEPVAAVVAEPVQPEPVVEAQPAAEPEPVAQAEPIAAPPVAAEPQPEPVVPAPPVVAVAPEPVQPEPVQPEPVQAEPVVEAQPEAEPEPQPQPQPESAPEPVEPQAVQPEQPEAPAEPAPVQPEVAPEPVLAEQPEAQPETEPTTPAEATAPAPAEATAQGEPAVDVAAEPAAGEPAPGYADAEREAVLRVMRERRDIRKGFRTDPIPHEVLLRVLEAAHTAPSVGHSQPWDFVVIRSAETRRTMHELAQRQREAYAKSLPKGRAKQFKELKIEAILDTPVNIVVTADPTRGGRHTLGRHTQPQMAPYSSALAVENLWLAARAEGLGVGWVSFFDEREMVRELGLPEHLEVVAYLCVGYVDEFPEEPELAQAGWSQRRPLSWVVHEETYGRRALPGEEPHDLLSETVASIRPLDAKALGEAWERQKRMTKPAGALGMLEIISAQLSGLSRVCPPPIPEPAAVAIFAGDHGVHAQGVTPWPQEVTTQMVANFLGGGAVCNAFANQVGAEVCVIDVGVAGDLPATPGLLPRKVRPGTADLSTGPAMTREEAVAAIEVGIETARDLVAAGNKALLTGEMGIANTTVSAALISVFTGVDPSEVTGRGTGINDETHARKVEVVRRALELHQPDPADPIGVLAAIGGLEHAAIVGLLLGGASLRTPVILDGVSAGAAALVARAIAPESLSACIAGHRSAEPGHVAALNKLGLRPLVDLDLRLGEGTGALLALPLVQSAARAMHEVATFDSAGVTEK